MFKRSSVYALIVVVVCLCPLFFNNYWMTLSVLGMGYMITALGMTVVLGYAGQISLAQAAFYGVGAFSVASLTVKLGWSFWLSALCGLIVSGLLGLVLGLLALRLKTHYLALVTIGFGIIVNLVLANEDAITGGTDGIAGIPRPNLFGFQLTSQTSFYEFELLLVVLVCVGLSILAKGRIGRALIALREDEIAAESSGIPTLRVKIIAFVLSALLGGLGGIIYASGAGYISPDTFSFNLSVMFLAMALIGGVDSIPGTLLGVVLLTIMPEVLRGLHGAYMAVYGVFVIVVMAVMPGGIFGLFKIFRAVRAVSPIVAKFVVDDHAERIGDVLVIENLSKFFGGIHAVEDVSLRVKQGTVHALIGPNGSGKTTMLNLISGLYRPTAGTIRLLDEDVTGKTPHILHTKGITRTFQNIRLFPEMTVEAAVRIALYDSKNGPLVEQVQQTREILSYVGITRYNDLCKNLPYGQRRLVEIARALISKPKILLLDEPAAGMNPEETNQLLHLLQKLKDAGLTILLVEHDMSLVRRISDEMTVLNFGRTLAQGKPQTVIAQPEVVRAYIGEGFHAAT